MATGTSAKNFGHSARKSGGGRTVSRRRSSCGRWMVYDIVQGQENQPTSYRSRKIGIRQKCSDCRGDLCFLGRRLKWVDRADMIIESGIEPSFSDLVNFIEKSARASGNMYGQDLVHLNTAGDKLKINKNPMPKQKVTTFATTSDFKKGKCSNTDIE